MTVTSVEVIDATGRQRALATLTLAFATDPIMRWAWPNSFIYATYWPRIADAFGGRAFDNGTAHGLGDFHAAALWLPPRVTPDEETVMELMAESMDEQLLGEIEGVFEQMAELHPADEHWYLPVVGVDPLLQGQGLGSAVLRHGLARCDDDGLPAYLEATSARNRDLYQRHGFAIVGVIQAGSSPPMWAMFREPTAERG